MAKRIIESQVFINPTTGRRLTNTERITGMIRDGTFQVPNGLIINNNGRLVLDTQKNRNGENYANGRRVNVHREQFDSNLYAQDIYRYPLNVIRNSGLGGRINVKYYFQDRRRVPISHEYELPVAGSLNTWWNEEHNSSDWMVDSDHFVFDGYTINADGDRIYNGTFNDGYFVVSQVTNLTPLAVVQNFREGISNCMLTPIRDHFERLKEGAEKKNRKDEYSKKIRQIDELITLYKDGVPQDSLDNITKLLNIGIKVNDIKGGIMLQSRSDASKIYKSFEYINNKLDHVELQYTKDAIPLSKSEFKHQIENLQEGDYFTSSLIVKKDATYKMQDPVYDQVRLWESSQQLDNIDYHAFPIQSDFILSSCHYGGSVNFSSNPYENLGSLRQIDHVKSYYNYKKCDLYNKYQMPCAPTIYRKVPHDFSFESFTGFWYIEDIKWNKLSPEATRYLKKLNIYNVATTFTTPELVYMRSIGLEFKLVYGAWNCKTQDIDMDPLLSIDIRCQKCQETDKQSCTLCRDNIKPYKVWSGKQASIKLDNIISLKCSKKMAQHLTSIYNERVRYDEHNEKCTISTAKTRVYHRAHITSYILAYSRIQVLRELLKLPYDKVRRICLDGIVHVEIDTPIPENFKIKPIEVLTTCEMDTYYSSYPQKNWNFPDLEEWNKHPIIYASGPGGSGKTHYFLTSANLVNPCYVASENKIIAEKRDEYGIKNTCTVQKLLVDSYNPADTKTMIIDECSKLNQTVVDRIIEKYPKSLIIFAGDVCQLPPFGKTEKERQRADYSKFYNLEFTTNYRCKCPELKKLLDYLRTLIKEGTNNNFIIEYLRNELKDQKGNLDNYKVEEYIITGTHKKIDEVTKILDQKGLPKKWIITKTTETNYTGDIVINQTKPVSSELRHAFTAHACQGLTIKNPNKMYIDLDGMFCLEMAYTTLSRCQYLSQIVVI